MTLPLNPIDATLAALRAGLPFVWPNPHRQPAADALAASACGLSEVDAARARW